MRSLRDMGDPYQHGPEVSFGRTDTGMKTSRKFIVDEPVAFC